MTLVVHEFLHLLVGGMLGLILSRLGIGHAVFVWVLLSSLLTDLDHIVDYLRTVGFRWDGTALATGSYFVSSGRVMVLLHSWELAGALVVGGLIWSGKRYGTPLLGLGVGLIGHLLVDQVWYRQPWATYFLTARWLHGFADPILWR
jgi:hypothetical protein